MAQKRIVAPDTPITTYPTPEISDIVITVDVDSRLPGYKALEYGTPYPDQTRYPGVKLISQTPLDDDRFVRRIYATDRVNQEAYNYAIKYSAGSPDHPIYIRTTIEPRDGYVPLADGAPDPVIPGAFLVDEEAAPADGELNSLYLKVTRVYETLPGPVVTSFETNEAGQKVTVTTQRKTSENYTLPQATATKSALAEADGTGVVNEQIREVPEVFPQTLVRVEKPVTIPERFLTANFTTTEAETLPDSNPTVGITGDVISQQVERTGLYTARKTTVELDLSNPETLYGVDYDQTTDTTIPFTEYISSAIPTTSCEADPIGGGKVLVKQYDVSGYREKLAGINLQFPTRSSIVGVPPILKRFEVLWEFTDSSQNQVGSAEGAAAGNTGTISISADSTSSATVSVVPKFIVEYEEVNTSNIPTTSFFFFLPYPVTLKDILTKTGSQQWPVFKPRSYVITANGQTVKKTLNINRRTAISWASESASGSIDLGNGSTTETQNNLATVTIQPSIMGGFAANVNSTRKATISVQLQSSLQLPSTVTGIGGVANPVSTTPATAVVEAAYNTAYTMPPTSPSDIPRSGKYLINSSVEPYKFGMAKVYAEVVDASIFGS